MGGHIALGIRRLDGSYETMGVWTNNLANKFQNPQFLGEGDTSLVEEYIKRYRDADQSKVAGFGGIMSHEPGEYGYVLVDCIEKIVYNWNSYSSLGFLDPYSFNISSISNRYAQWAVDYRNSLRPFLKGIEVYQYEKNGWVQVPFDPTISDDELLKLHDSLAEDGSNVINDRFMLRSDHWTIHEWQDRKDVAKEVYEHLKSIITLTAAEDEEWQYRLKRGR